MEEMEGRIMRDPRVQAAIREVMRQAAGEAGGGGGSVAGQGDVGAERTDADQEKPGSASGTAPSTPPPPAPSSTSGTPPPSSPPPATTAPSDPSAPIAPSATSTTAPPAWDPSASQRLPASPAASKDPPPPATEAPPLEKDAAKAPSPTDEEAASGEREAIEYQQLVEKIANLPNMSSDPDAVAALIIAKDVVAIGELLRDPMLLRSLVMDMLGTLKPEGQSSEDGDDDEDDEQSGYSSESLAVDVHDSLSPAGPRTPSPSTETSAKDQPFAPQPPPSPAAKAPQPPAASQAAPPLTPAAVAPAAAGAGEGRGSAGTQEEELRRQLAQAQNQRDAAEAKAHHFEEKLKYVSDHYDRAWHDQAAKLIQRAEAATQAAAGHAQARADVEAWLLSAGQIFDNYASMDQMMLALGEMVAETGKNVQREGRELMRSVGPAAASCEVQLKKLEPLRDLFHKMREKFQSSNINDDLDQLGRLRHAAVAEGRAVLGRRAEVASAASQGGDAGPPSDASAVAQKASAGPRDDQPPSPSARPGPGPPAPASHGPLASQSPPPSTGQASRPASPPPSSQLPPEFQTDSLDKTRLCRVFSKSYFEWMALAKEQREDLSQTELVAAAVMALMESMVSRADFAEWELEIRCLSYVANLPEQIYREVCQDVANTNAAYIAEVVVAAVTGDDELEQNLPRSRAEFLRFEEVRRELQRRSYAGVVDAGVGSGQRHPDTSRRGFGGRDVDRHPRPSSVGHTPPPSAQSGGRSSAPALPPQRPTQAPAQAQGAASASRAPHTRPARPGGPVNFFPGCKCSVPHWSGTSCKAGASGPAAAKPKRR